MRLRRNRRYSSRRRLLGGELDFAAGVEGLAAGVLHVEEGDEGHVADEGDGAGGLERLEDVHAQGTAADPFEEGEGDVAAVEDRQREEIEHGEVDVDEDGEPEGE